MKYYYCYNTIFGLFQEEINYTKDLDIYIFYNECLDMFYDKHGNPIDIKDKIIFPRSSIKKSKQLVSAIKKHQGIPLVDNIDFDITLNWPHYINTTRKNIILSGQFIKDQKQWIKTMFGSDKVFFKTKHKNYSSIIDVKKLLGEDSAFNLAIEEHLDDDFIISDAITVEKDKYGPLEYRAFIIEGNIYNISRVSHALLHSIPKEVIEKIKTIQQNLTNTDFPKSYVIDIFIYRDIKEKQIVDVLECNPIISSGTYLYNSIFEKNPDLEHQDKFASIPKEKTKYDKKTAFTYKPICGILPTVFYNLPGGFAADLLSYSLYGENSTYDGQKTLKK